MKRKTVIALCMLSIAATMGSYSSVMAEEKTSAEAAAESKEAIENELKDGIYTADFDTDSNMFHVNEAKDGKGTLTVKNGEMTIHVSLVSKSIVNLFSGKAEDAQKEGAKVLEPTEDEVTYSDGYKETVYGFDIPVPSLEEEFDVALLGKKGKWYDHKVSVSNPQPAENSEETGGSSEGKTAEELKLEDGDYTVEVALEGGSGKATVESPAEMKISDGKAMATITWSSPNYDYMIVDGEKYLPVNEEGANSEFEIPVTALDEGMPVIADTTAMGAPHEINYTLTFYSESIGSKSQMPQEAAKRVVAVALVIIVGGGILNYFVNKRNRC